MLADSDQDGYLDAVEILNGHNPNGTGRLVDADADQDGLVDRLELAFGTDPTNPDTDQDGHKDFDEIYGGFSPTSSQPIVLEKSIVVHLKNQQLEQKVMGIALAAYPVSTGMPGRPTPLGTYHVLSKSPRAWSSSAKLWMPYWMHFSGRGHGLHELPEWPGGRKEGADHLGKPVSHGCVRMGVGTAKKIYEWSPIGTTVTILAR